ncbi:MULTISPECIES: adenylate/guanylate cyclase domain-containing response regulator [unclassified Mycobacterium]|uniref:adenylate/guanylate cyclase domain-containing protein n=1 Tax=unclassified Mycobacterium TaxID=2642494 RepID=UPI0007FE3934|nr:MULTISPECIES: adenylate/guanylate cyclase domain-containing response regulator [unclassified Mycobacterium]OBH07956.1 cyclase [Mycobacterium sp. E3247]OBI19068.1 cyclase [Mycobacterium sp. E2497]
MQAHEPHRGLGVELAEKSQPVRLLVVDDEEDVQALFRGRFRKELQRGEYTLSFTTDPLQALKMVDESPDLEVLITDLNMPAMNGLELLAEVAKLRRPLKTIVLTAYNDARNIRGAMMRGAFDFQVKPLDLEDLRATIAKAVTIVRELQAGEEARRRTVELVEQKRRVEEIFGRYVCEEVKAQLLACPEGHLGSERRTLTVLMADIRGFTGLSEVLPPEQVVQVLNGYLERATEVMFRRNGTINEILGDGMLVFFGAPISDDDATANAVAAALELQLAMNDLNATHRREGLPELALGIGVHTGEAVVGTIGSRRRQKYTAIGKTVNLVARIESHSVGGQVLVSDWAYREIRDVASTLASFQVRVKGITEPVTVHDVRGLAGEYNLQLPTVERALTRLPAPISIGVAVIKDKVIGDPFPAELIASGAEAVRVRSQRVIPPFDDLMLDVAGATIFAKVVESDSQQGFCDVLAVYTSVADDARRALAALGS